MMKFFSALSASCLTVSNAALPLLGALLLCFAPAIASGQTIVFTGTQVTLPISGLDSPNGIAVDSLGDVFISAGGLVELPVTIAGYDQQLTYLASPSPAGFALDSAGDVFSSNESSAEIFEVAKTPAGYGDTALFPSSGLSNPYGVSVNAAGDVFVSEPALGEVLELPVTGTAPTTLPTSGLDYPYGIALDSAGDLFIADTANNRVVELPKTGAGYGPQSVLPFTGLSYPFGIAVSPAGDLYVADTYNSRIVTLPKAAAGYGQQLTLPLDGLSYPEAVAAAGAGNVFVADTYNNRIVELQTSSVHFPDSNVCAPGQTTPAPCSQTLTLNFRTRAAITLSNPQVLIGNTPSVDFTVAAGTTCTGEVDNRSTCTVNVTFAPQTDGVRNGVLELTSGSGTVLTTVPLSGFGIGAANAPPVAHLSTTYMQFGTVPFGSTVVQPLTITNVGGGMLPIFPLISGHSFTITASTCGEVGLAAGESCTLDMQYSPTNIAVHTDTLTLQTNAMGSHTVSLVGTTAGLSVFGGVSGAALQFGPLPVGSTKVLPLTVTNVGLPGTVPVYASITESEYRPYTILTTAQNTCTAGIAPGQSCVLPVQFSPRLTGLHDDVLSLSSQNSPVTTVYLQGGTGLKFSSTKLHFGTVAVGSSDEQTLTITNVGLPGTITVQTTIYPLESQDAIPFSVLTTAQNTCLAGIASGQSCTIPVQFSPPSIDGDLYNEFIDTLELDWSGGGYQPIDLDGYAVAAP